MTLWHRVGKRAVASLLGMAVAWLCGPSPGLVGAEPRFSVDYNGSRLSVEAHEANLFAVLSEIGAKVGFRVVGTAASSPVVTLSIRDAALDEALSRLLWAENHTVTYRAGADGAPQIDEPIDRIVLSGEANASPALGSTEAAQSRLRDVAPENVSPTTAPPTTSLSPRSWLDASSRITWDLPLARIGMEDAAEQPITVGNLLKAHATVAIPAALPTNLDADPTSSAQLGFEVTLAEMTRRARQALGALIDGLAIATRSLQPSGQ